mmetsp:Transcript_18990/g.27338  ORF Transcript_18990/g.27338 Transcript_18990/m.27338 type:complete len:446 (+) Transcript_18990:92-1429(+)
MSRFHLKFGDVPRYPFANKEFKVDIHLVDDTDLGRLVCREEVPLKLELRCVTKDKSLTHCDCLIVHNGPLSIVNGTCTARITITCLSMNQENKNFVLLVSPLDVMKNIEPAISGEMFAVNYRILLTNNEAMTWYKDQGGQNNCIEIPLRVEDCNGCKEKSTRIPLKATLCYKDGGEVSVQGILKIKSGDTVVEGSTVLRLRIEEVSRSHRGRAFVVRIAPITKDNPLNNAISPAVTDGIFVMSKSRPTIKGGDKPTDKGGDRKRGAEVAVSQTREDCLRHRTEKIDNEPSMAMPSRIPSCVRSPSESSAIFKNLMEWAQSTMTEIEKLQWIRCGVDDETMEPIYRRRNPNKSIRNLVERFNNSAVPAFDVLWRDCFSASYDENNTVSDSAESSKSNGSSMLGYSGNANDGDAVDTQIPALEQIPSLSELGTFDIDDMLPLPNRNL